MEEWGSIVRRRVPRCHANLFCDNHKEFLGCLELLPEQPRMTVELRYLHAFHTVCDAGSLRAAAARLHRSEQAVGYQLRRLEECLGLPLFERREGRLQPNSAGQRLWAFCRDMQQDWLRLHDEIRMASDEPLRIAAVSGYGRYVLLPLFREGPLADVAIHMQYPTAKDVMRSVEAGECELGFVHHLPAPGSLLALAVDSEEIVLIAPSRWPVPTLDAASLSEQIFITYDESDYVFATWFADVLSTSPPVLRTAAHFEELEEVLDWVAGGRGLSIVPLPCLAAHERPEAIRVIRSAETRCSNVIHAVLRADSRTRPAIMRTLATLKEWPAD
ncbi:LysR family transcriptional regulator [Rhodanobacter umsongensis]|uniref:LysR family transcriptional regulator n=1 Tax=Rhodanobacter umsongensis TaxID=633153 RepID=A0ABW0JL18_9GAMM